MTRLLAAAAMLAAPGAAGAQAMHDMAMPGMAMPAKTAAKTVRTAKKASPRVAPSTATPPKPAKAPAPASIPIQHGMDHGHMPGMAMPAPAAPATQPTSDAAPPGVDMSGRHAGHAMAMPATSGGATSIVQAIGVESAPPAPRTPYADRQFGAAAMAPSHARMMRENGGQRLSQILFNLAEYQVRDGVDGYRWDGEGWFGGDTNRIVLKSEGSGTRRGVDAAEAQTLYSRAIGPYFDLQAGVRHDFARRRARSYATIGVEGLAPYMLQTAAALFVSSKGEVSARLEGWYDQRVTQRITLQPRVELNLAAQDVAAARIGAGLSDAELGLRLRYEIGRRFAPYVGVSHDARTGRSARYARADGTPVATTGLVAGLRFWF